MIDLRTAREIDRDGPTAVAARGVETVPLSFIPEDGTALPESGDDSDPLLRAYLGYLVDRTENVVQAVRLLGRPDAGPTLVHCAAGKDRTGVLLALVLDAVGVEREAVIADYALSAQHVEAMFRRWTSALGREMPADLTPHLPRAEVIATVLSRLDDEHGRDGRRRRGGLAAGERARRRLARSGCGRGSRAGDPAGASPGEPRGPVSPLWNDAPGESASNQRHRRRPARSPARRPDDRRPARLGRGRPVRLLLLRHPQPGLPRAPRARPRPGCSSWASRGRGRRSST